MQGQLRDHAFEDIKLERKARPRGIFSGPGGRERRRFMEYYILAVGIAISAFAFAQEAAPKQFEVASIKPDHSSDNRMGVALEPGGRFVATNVPARFLIQFAYQLKDNQLSGLPGWADSDRYDIAAKP